MLDRRREDRLRLIQVAPGIEHVVDLGAVLGPLLDLVEIAVVRDQRLISLFVRRTICSSHGCRTELLRKTQLYFLHRSIQRQQGHRV